MRIIKLTALSLFIFMAASPAMAQNSGGREELLSAMALEYRPDALPDYQAAAARYRAAAAAGSREAWLGLVRLTEPGGPLWSGPEPWRENLLAASRAGWPEAAFQLAQALEKQTVPADGLDPMQFYVQAAAAGFGPAALRLGEIYLEGGSGLARDERQASIWLAVAAENHEAAAGLALGKMYYDTNPAAAARWLERANSPEGGYLLGQLYLKDKRSIEAVAAFTASADQGYPPAHLALGLINLDNDFGRKPNPREALKYLKIAAQADLPEGSYQLARMYLTGTATPKDPITGAYWLHRAAARGHEKAGDEYDKLVYNFSVGQKKRLERMIEDDSVPGMQTPVQ